ncbi:histidinol-phosphate transaminase [Candidatus Methylacidithermus pantelleriae]|uniref:Histidinol-phosphate aminotransferase n=1 Tax=Candidatus Methylacidithermus pantelleriae TaxID=2744239 RepID=A0A8J2BGM6_9BACT|nr:histidinol-phosphate transaminase [Candidatus Methylacidithermus pantelleriae]CAF0691974.1 Histidinol-phosphate aminotransferase [Candidatus Methylacidithermus pantelleriae]
MDLKEQIQRLANPYLLELVPYEPGRPIEEVARELGLTPTQIIKLASNENPLGPSPKALAAIKSVLPQIHRYPDGSGYRLIRKLSDHLQVESRHIVLGNGSNEIIELLFHTFVRPGVHEILISRYSFLVYRLMAQLFGVRFRIVEEENFVVRPRAFLQAVGPATRLIFLANPNNPTGTRVPTAELEELVSGVPDHVIVVVDEAYYEFLEDPPPSIRWVLEGKSLVLLRTFSKAHGLAGLRIGYGIAPVPICELLQRARQPFNVNMLAQVAAEAALEDREHIQRTRDIVRTGLRDLQASLAKLGLSYVPSSANFLLIKVGQGTEVFRRLLPLGIIVRSMESYGLPEWIRVSIGLPEEMKRFVEALTGLVQNGLSPLE